MRFTSRLLLLPALGLMAAPLQAQPARGTRQAGGWPGSPGAEFFLARTGELRLTDAQVVRLAAIARRSADRRRALRATLDSLAPARQPGVPRDSAARAARMREMAQFRARFDREREQARADLREALAVLTADQQAMAWEMAARAPRGGRAARGSRFRDGRGDSRAPRERRRGGRPSPPPGPRPPQI